MFIEGILVALILDAYLYWGHVLMHKWKPLIKIHAVHHRDYAPNFHLLEFMILWLIPMLVSWLFGYMLAGFIVAFLFVYEVSLTHRKVYKTSNKAHKWIFKLLKGWLGNAKFHKAHHDYPNKNFSQMFTFWDKIMKTEHKKKKEAA